MPLLPRAVLLMNFPLSAPELSERLAAAVEPVNPVRLGRPEHPFEGWVGGNRFEIRRIDTRHFLARGIQIVPNKPRIEGTVEPTATGSRIRATVSLHPAILVFFGIWFVAVLGANVAAYRTVMASGFAFEHLLPPAMLLFGWVALSGGVMYEARKARELLFRIARRSDAPDFDVGRA